MRIEVLFPERCNLYGDLSNVEYLKRCLPQAEFVETSLQEEPRFAKEPVDLVYLGPMTERTQELVLERLRLHRERLEELIVEDGSVLSTSFSVQEGNGLLTVTLKAQCREQIGREVTFAGQVGEIIPGTQEG